MLGGSYYMGELNPGKQFYRAKPAGGLLYRKNFNPRYALKLNVLYGTIEAYDADSESKSQQQRNLSFRSQVFDFSTQIEFNFLPFTIGNKEKSFSPYIFGGISIFKYNPEAALNGEWYKLQPLKTEGHKYSLVQPAFPFGLGLKLSIGDKFALGMEWGLRRTFNDYIDDVSTTYADPDQLREENGEIAVMLADRSLVNNGENTGLQRGNSKNNDWYSFAGLTLTFKLLGKEQCVGVNK